MLTGMANTPWFAALSKAHTATAIQSKVIPPRSLVVGVPGKVIREITDEQFEGILKNAALYVEEGKLYLD